MIAADSSVLIDLISGQGAHSEAAAATLRQALHVGPVVLCDVALAEVCSSLRGGAQIVDVLEEIGVGFSPMEPKAALRAGEMQRRYRQRLGARAGDRSRTVADFLIGAHAMMQCDALITRDAAFYRDYFKGLKVIVPQA